MMRNNNTGSVTTARTAAVKTNALGNDWRHRIPTKYATANPQGTRPRAYCR